MPDRSTSPAGQLSDEQIVRGVEAFNAAVATPPYGGTPKGCAAFRAGSGEPASSGETAFEEALKQTWCMVDPFNPPPAGSYWRGQYEGICAALRTLRENYDRARASSSLRDQAPAESLVNLVHALHYAAYSWGFEAGKVGQHVDTTIAGNKADAALAALLKSIAAPAESGNSTNGGEQ